jgi:hypothetical protein
LNLDDEEMYNEFEGWIYNPLFFILESYFKKTKKLIEYRKDKYDYD